MIRFLRGNSDFLVWPAVVAILLMGIIAELTNKKEEVYVHLGQAQQICAGKDHTAQVDIFVDMEKEHDVDFILSDGTKINGLHGKSVHLKLDHCGMGSHEVQIFVSTIRKEPYFASFSVWECDDKEAK